MEAITLLVVVYNSQSYILVCDHTEFDVPEEELEKIQLGKIFHTVIPTSCTTCLAVFA